ncbi:MAG: translation factor GTPase family protein, partial [Bacteroidota bacterium]
MLRNQLRHLRNIGVAAHIDAGKTTLTERILYFTGKSHKLGETHLGNSQMDTGKQEIEKGITISSAATHTEWTYQNDRYHFNIIDTPGHVDFMIEVERSLRVLDGMVALFDAVAGVESQTETVWQQAAHYGVPVIAMVNKMDRAGADFTKVVQQMRSQLATNALAIQWPVGSEENFEGVVDLITLQLIRWDADGQMQVIDELPAELQMQVLPQREQLLEALALLDESLMEQYLTDADSITVQQCVSVLRQATLERKAVPVLMGAAYKNRGVQPLLDAVCAYLPSPLDRGAVQGNAVGATELISRAPSSEAAFAALAFKMVLDEQNRQLSFFRVYAGQLRVGDVLLNPRTGRKERIGRLYQMHANKRQEVKMVSAGDIAATTGLKSVRTGDTLCAPEAPIVLESLLVPQPVISVAIEAKHSDELDKLSMALAKLQLEDPSLRVQKDEVTGQTLMMGMGELHLEIVVDKLMTDFRVAVNVGAPRVAYQEVFSKTLQHRYRFKKQDGGTGLFAEIEVRIGPADAEYLQSEAFAKSG